MPTTGRALATTIAICLVLAAVACSDDGNGGDGDGGTSTTRPTFGAGLDRPGSTEPRRDELDITALSTRADRVTGGDVLVEVTVPPDVEVDTLTVTSGDTDISGGFAGEGRVRTALVTDLDPGSTEIRARVGEDLEATLEVVNHALTGPVISGPHLPLVACSTEAAGLGPPTDEDCSAPTVVDHRYVTTEGRMADLPDPAARPADLAMAVIDGERVPLVIRRERGVINRGLYTFAVVDPEAGRAGLSPPTLAGPTPVDPDGLAWNGRLVWRFGGGCGTTYAQGRDGATAEDPALLARGYAVASSTFTTFQTHCNDVLSAETVMMVKEHIIETIGPPDATIGQGSSGGAIQQHLMVQNYPGLLDAAASGQPFPDAVSISSGVTDCALLQRYYATPAGAALDPAQRAVINGHATDRTCAAWDASFVQTLRPSEGCADVPETQRYDADLRRRGLRCTLPDVNIATLGVDARSGFANRPLDNVGVQYGLNALNTGVITTDQFIDLNASIGGFDVDGGFSPARTGASAATIATAYAGGRLAIGGGDLRVIPLIDVNTFTDPQGDIHDRFRAFSLRDRLRQPDGQPAPNHLIWTRRPGDPGEPATEATPVGADVMTQAVTALDRWLTAVEADEAGGNRAEVVARARPADVADECLDPNGFPIRDADIYQPNGACFAEFPISGDPRTAAGERLSNDVLKCAAVPIDPTSYAEPPNLDQRQGLTEAFPAGVCDWTARGEGQLDVFGTWLSYAEGLPFDPARLLELDRQSGLTGRDDEDQEDEGEG